MKCTRKKTIDALEIRKLLVSAYVMKAKGIGSGNEKVSYVQSFTERYSSIFFSLMTKQRKSLKIKFSIISKDFLLSKE